MDMETTNNVEEMPKTTSPKSKRRLLLTVLAVLFAMALLSFVMIYQVIIAESHARYNGIRSVAAEKVSKIIRGAEMNANNIFDEVARNLDSPEHVIAALKTKASLNLDVRGYFAAFTPDYFPEKGAWFEPYIYQPEYGGFEYRQVGSARHNYTKSPWYISALERNASFWSEPYYYYDGTAVSGHYTTFVKPIYDTKGDLACVCGADMKFEWLAKELEWVDQSSKSNKVVNRYKSLTDFDFYTVILGSDGTSIVAPEEKTVALTDENVLKALAQKKGGVTELDIDGEACSVYYGPIEYVDWSVAVIVPKSDIVKPLLPIALILLGMVVVGIMIVRFVCKK
jgi:hypothetical protein